jgi:hypothetical protein
LRGFLTFVAVGLAGICVYALPSLVELALVKGNLNPWISCVILGDLFGSVILFLLGFRKLAVAIYVLSSVAEGLALWMRLIPVTQLIWFTNLAPAIAVGVILVQAALRDLVVDES